MKTIRVEWKVLLLSATLLATTTALAQVPAIPGAGTAPTTSPTSVRGAIQDTAITPSTAQTGAAASTDSLPDAQLDKAVAALEKGDKAASAQALQTGIAAVEAEAQQKPSSFKDKILSQVGKLKTLLPLITGGGLGAGVLGKAVGLTKLASGAGRLENLVSAGSLIGKASQLSSGLSGLGSAMSVLGGGGSAGKSLVSTALAGVSKLGQGGPLAKTAEPAVKNQIGSVLNFVKGAL
ncbi:hypothetical protein GGR92_004160 [Spirosoma lacussanchae]|uniref:hypothetical protein n=1 Tax=Spirosoma lacussanchae TaxID=1884249 RepID=UPI001FE4CD37|nr:hypothetical protein [Spirosoma lacussanchae]